MAFRQHGLDGWRERFDHRRHRLRDRLMSWPLEFRVLGAIAIVAFLAIAVLAVVGGDDERPLTFVADTTSTTARIATTTVAPTTTLVPATTTMVPTTTTLRTTTVQPVTPTTARSATTAPPTTRPRSETHCGYEPGAVIEVEINGRVIGSETANGDGCITVNR